MSNGRTKAKVLEERLELSCDQLPFLQGISLRGYSRMKMNYMFLNIFLPFIYPRCKYDSKSSFFILKDFSES